MELAKKFDDPKARAFINGVLNAIKNELEANGGVIEEVVPAVEKPMEDVMEEILAMPATEEAASNETASDETTPEAE